MSDDMNATGQEPGAMPPKQSPFKTVTAGGASAPKTIVLKRPTLRRPGEAAPQPSPISSAAPIPPPSITPSPALQPVEGAKPLSQTAQVAQGIAISPTDAAKKMTSRISVSSATSPIPPISSLSAAPGADSVLQNPKKMTSRISLESAFSTQPEIASSQPKTIRLKRPQEAAAPSVTPPPAEPEAAPSIGGGDSPTQKKTIRVKRPGGGAGAPKISLNRPDGGMPPSDNLQSLTGFSQSQQKTGESDKVNPFFVITGIVAIIVGLVLCWALAAQTFGDCSAMGDFAFAKGPIVSPPPGLATYR